MRTYLDDFDDFFPIRNKLPYAVIPGHLSIRCLGRDVKLHGVLLYAVDGPQLGSEGVGIGVNLKIVVVSGCH